MPLTIDIDYSDGKLYLLHSGKPTALGNIIDVYDPASGTYLHSYRLPRDAREIAVVGNYILALGKPDGHSYNFTQYALP